MWCNFLGSEIVIEEGDVKDGRSMCKFIIIEMLGKEIMDVFVVVWCLRSWYDVVESKDVMKSSMWNFI